MERWMMTLEDSSDRRQRVIAAAQYRKLRNGEMPPGNEREPYGRECAENLRDQNNSFSTESIRQMAGRQRQGNDRHCDDQPDQTKSGRRMRARVKLPFHCHRQHQTASDRE